MPDREPCRILVTGSRTWGTGRSDFGRLSLALGIAAGEAAAAGRYPLIVHGAARGADQMAAEIAEAYEDWGFRTEAHPADWEGPCRPECKPGHRRERGGRSYCPAAGNYRNAELVALGASVCLAFIRDGSAGASHCARLAEQAGIPVRRYEETG